MRDILASDKGGVLDPRQCELALLRTSYAVGKQVIDAQHCKVGRD